LGEKYMSIIRNLERLELHETVHTFGFTKGAQIYWLHNFANLPENQKLSLQQLKREIVEILRVPKCSVSTFDKTYALYQKIKPHLMTRNIQDKIEIME
jgi:hypothetical protein